ncbi:hypothetical protein [Escherichia coli]|uniref:hypothetical protein n=1 Tax=Escherichia coli TaxID=562 RepID=UPI0039A50CD9
MIDAKVLEGVKNWLSIYGRLTCGILAEKMNMPPSSMVYFLRDAVDAGVLTECNGFYDIPRPRPVQPVRRKCSQEGTEHVLRYLIVDRTAAPAGISAEVA